MNYLRKITIFLVLLSIFNAHIVSATPNPPMIKAKSAIVIDGLTGKVLYNYNAEEQRYPASTTKMMSLIIALEKGNLDDIVTASQQAANTEGSSLWLTEGEQLKLIDLLYGIMLISGNDATVAVAEHLSGSVEKFAQAMTEKAHQIGAKDTNFTNSSGLPDPKHVTTAHDLARIAAYGYKNPLFAEIVGTKHKVIPWAGKEFGRDLYNEDRMLWLYEGGNGVKTGYTDLAGRCLVSGAKRNEIQLIAVVLDSETMWDDSIKLLDLGFSQVKPETIIHKEDILKTIRVTNGKTEVLKLVANSDLVVPIFADGANEFSTTIDVPAKVEAPIVKGQKLGMARVFYQDKEIARIDLEAEEDVERKSFFQIIAEVIKTFLKNFAVKKD